MQGAHVAGGGFGAVIGAVLAGALRQYVGWDISDVDAALIGSAALGVGVGLGHLVASIGLVPAFRRVLYGPEKPQAIVTVAGPRDFLQPAIEPVAEHPQAAPEADHDSTPGNGNDQTQ